MCTHTHTHRRTHINEIQVELKTYTYVKNTYVHMKFHTCSFVENATKENRIAGQTYQKTNSIDSRRENVHTPKNKNKNKEEFIFNSLQFLLYLHLFAFIRIQTYLYHTRSLYLFIRKEKSFFFFKCEYLKPKVKEGRLLKILTKSIIFSVNLQHFALYIAKIKGLLFNFNARLRKIE